MAEKTLVIILLVTHNTGELLANEHVGKTSVFPGRTEALPGAGFSAAFLEYAQIEWFYVQDKKPFPVLIDCLICIV